MNSVIFRPAPACARHARKKFHCCLISWVIVLIAAFPLTFSQQALGAAGGFIPNPNQPTIPASLSGVVYFDANHNGLLDTGEYAICGGTIDLYQGSNLKATAQVNCYGQYSFPDLDPGTYKVYNTTQGNWLPVPGSIQAMDQTTSASLASGGGMEIDNVKLNAGDQGKNFDFAAQYYPIQLLTKRMLLASTPADPSFTSAVPEPSTVVLLSFAAIPFIVRTALRHYRKR